MNKTKSLVDLKYGPDGIDSDVFTNAFSNRNFLMFTSNVFQVGSLCCVNNS